MLDHQVKYWYWLAKQLYFENLQDALTFESTAKFFSTSNVLLEVTLERFILDKTKRLHTQNNAFNLCGSSESFAVKKNYTEYLSQSFALSFMAFQSLSFVVRWNMIAWIIIATTLQDYCAV